MARVTGPYFRKGRMDDLQFYEMHGERYVCMVSSLTGKRVKKDPAFTRTMQYAGWLAKASKIASAVYRQIPKEQRAHNYYRVLTGKAMQLLKQAITPEEVYALLYNEVFPPQPVAINTTSQPSAQAIAFADALLHTVFSTPKPIQRRAIQYIVMDNSPP